MKTCEKCGKQHGDDQVHAQDKSGQCVSVVTVNDEVVRAAGTSEGAKKGWESRSRDAYFASAAAHAHDLSEGRFAKAHLEKSAALHEAAKEAHSSAAFHTERAQDMSDVQSKIMTGRHEQLSAFHAKEARAARSLIEKAHTKAFDATSSDIVHCRAHSSVGPALGASEPWAPGARVEFMWMPAGVHTITAGFRRGSIELTVQCDEGTASAVQASLDAWRADRPKQEPFGCVEHREHEASVRVSASGGFAWRNDGVYLAAEPTTLGAQNVNGKVHRSWSPSFTTDADYASASEADGVLRFPEGARGSRANPARITGVDFCVGTLTNKPAFHAMSPVKAAEAVTAAGTSEGSRKGWAKRVRGHAHLVMHLEEAANVADLGGGHYIAAIRDGIRGGVHHLEDENHVGAAHAVADYIQDRVSDNNEANKRDEEAERKPSVEIARKARELASHIRQKMGFGDAKISRNYGEGVKIGGQDYHNFTNAKATDATPPDSVRAHCRENLLRDVPDATKEEIAEYERVVDGGGAHGDAVYELRKARKSGFVSSAEALAAKHAAAVARANAIAAECGAARLTAQDVYERHAVTATWSDAAQQAVTSQQKATIKDDKRLDEHLNRIYARAGANR